MTGAVDRDRISRFDPQQLPSGLAGLGAALMGAAGLTLVSSKWADLTHAGRLVTLLISMTAAVVAAWSLRDLAPRAASALELLATGLAPLSVASATLASGGDWRSALTVGGVAAVAAAEGARRRHPAVVADWAAAAGVVAFAGGVGATYGVAAPVLVGGAALLLVATGPQRRSVSIIAAHFAGLAPAFRLLEDVAFTGQGTLREFGLIERADPWTTLGAGACAAIALGWHAVRARSIPVAVVSAVVVAATALELWAQARPPAAIGWLAIAVGAVLVEALLFHPAVYSNVADVVPRVVMWVAAALTALSVRWAWLEVLGIGEFDRDAWALTAATLAGYWCLVELRTRLSGQEQALPVGAIGLAAGGWSALVLVGAGVVAAGAWLVLIGVVAGATDRRWSAAEMWLSLAGVMLMATSSTTWSLAASSVAMLTAAVVYMSRRVAGTAGLAVAHSLMTWWLILDLFDVTAGSLFLQPLVLVGWLAAMSNRVSPTVASAVSLAVATALAVGFWWSDGDPTHTIALVAVASAIAVAGALRDVRGATTAGVAVALGATMHVALDMSTGVAGWAWLAVVGVAVLAAAVVLEASSEVRPETVSSQS